MNQIPPTTRDEKNHINFKHRFVKKHAVPIFIFLATAVVQFLLLPYVVDAGEMTIQALTKCTNEIRLKHADNELFINPNLTAAAENKLNDMAQYSYWAHENPSTNKKPWDFVDEAGYYYETTGENLAIGFENSEEICQAWEKSQKHFENIVNPTYQEMGFAIDKAHLRKDANGILVVLMFGSRNDFTGPVQFGNSETQEVCGLDDPNCGHGGVPQVEGVTTTKNSPDEKSQNNILFVIGISLLPLIFIVISKKISPHKMSRHRKIVFLIIAAVFIAVVALNYNFINKHVLNFSQEVQTAVLGSNQDDNQTAEATEGTVDVVDIENSSAVRGHPVQK